MLDDDYAQALAHAERAQEYFVRAGDLRQAHLLPFATLEFDGAPLIQTQLRFLNPPYWMGIWFGVYPTAETLIA